MIVMQNIFFEKEIFISKTTHVIGAKNFVLHNKVYGICFARIMIEHLTYEPLVKTFCKSPEW